MHEGVLCTQTNSATSDTHEVLALILLLILMQSTFNLELISKALQTTLKQVVCEWSPRKMYLFLER